jgi:hypothetical protein
MRFITGEKTTTRASPKYKKFVRYNCGSSGKRPEQVLAILRRVRSLSWYGLTFRTLNGQIAGWRETGVPRSLVLHLREMFKDSWKEIIAEENRAKANKRKKRGHRPDPKHKPVIREVVRDKIARQIGWGDDSEMKAYFHFTLTKSDRAKINAASNLVSDAVIRVYDEAGNVIETHEHAGEFKEP